MTVLGQCIKYQMENINCDSDHFYLIRWVFFFLIISFSQIYLKNGFFFAMHSVAVFFSSILLIFQMYFMIICTATNAKPLLQLPFKDPNEFHCLYSVSLFSLVWKKTPIALVGVNAIVKSSQKVFQLIFFVVVISISISKGTDQFFTLSISLLLAPFIFCWPHLISQRACWPQFY